MCSGQQFFEVSLLEGTAKIQRSQKRTWEDLALGKKIYDNDIVETFFQTRIILSFGERNVIILGSNSKLLLNIVKSEEGGEEILDVSVTLFSGGVFAKAVSKSFISIYTANAVATTGKGAVSAIVEEKTGETGFQVIGGDVQARNIAQQEALNLNSGQTTMVFPGKEPTAPLYITYRHVAVLKHFFGSEYIDSELASAGIQPTDDRGSTNRRNFADGFMAGKPGQGRVEGGFQKRVFTLNRIYESILEEQQKNKKQYTPIKKTGYLFDNNAAVKFTSSFAMSNAALYPAFTIVPSYSLSFMDIGLRFSVASNYEGLGVHQFSETAGFMDLIHHFDLGFPVSGDKGFFKLSIGSFENLTLGSGLVVNRLTNKNDYSLYHPLGFTGTVTLEDISANIFVSDFVRFGILGAHVSWKPIIYHLGAGYYFDLNQYDGAGFDKGARFVYPDSIPPADSLPQSSAHVYEVDIGMDLISNFDMNLQLNCEYAQKIAGGAIDGYVTRIPSCKLVVNGIETGAGFIVEAGRLLWGQFHSFYPSNRCRIITEEDSLFLQTQNRSLQSEKASRGFDVFFRMNPIPGMAVDARYKQTIGKTGATIADKSDTLSNIADFTFYLGVSVNQHLLKPIQYGKIFVSQEKGGLYYPGSAPFASWGFSAGLDVQTVPLFFNLALHGGLRFYYLDVSPVSADGSPLLNNRIDIGDNTVEFNLGVARGVL
ncbi:MAG: hypothetical protein GF350_14450 [Chitinivibrionales bacterium]|nr:hypothetical protein [Chitinivibrionales bacterium]